MISNQVLATVLAVSAALPVEDTPEVKAAKAQFEAQFRAAEQGMHAQLAPVQGPEQYLADDADVAEAKERFSRIFEATEQRDEYHAKLAQYKEMMYRQYFAYHAANPYYHQGAGYAPYMHNGFNGFNGYNMWNLGYNGYNNWAHPQYYY